MFEPNRRLHAGNTQNVCIFFTEECVRVYCMCRIRRSRDFWVAISLYSPITHLVAHLYKRCLLSASFWNNFKTYCKPTNQIASRIQAPDQANLCWLFVGVYGALSAEHCALKGFFSVMDFANMAKKVCSCVHLCCIKEPHKLFNQTKVPGVLMGPIALSTLITTTSQFYCI